MVELVYDVKKRPNKMFRYKRVLLQGRCLVKVKKKYFKTKLRTCVLIT
jgi:hypothetical protein